MAENQFPAEGSVVGFGVFMDVRMGMICCTLAKAKHGRRARKVRAPPPLPPDMVFLVVLVRHLDPVTTDFKFLVVWGVCLQD
jgi:hypothetical protein